MRELADCATFLRTERKNALDSYDTHSWGDRGKEVILNALKSRQTTFTIPPSPPAPPSPAD